MMDDFSSMQTLNHQLSSLFLGDLSIYSTEKDIRHLFRNYGIIDTVRIKRGGSGKPHLSYGFIKFRDRESAELAMKELNGTVFLGRALRIGWAEPKSNTKVIKPRRESKNAETAQIHVSFISKQVDALITEATLRGLFSMYGEIVDVAIKKTQFDKKLKIQNGYGFVHYALTPEGVQSAVTATKAIHQVTIDRVTYDCSLSHALETIVGPEVAAEIYSPKRPLAHTMSMSTYENQGSNMPTYGMPSAPMISPRAELGGVGSTYGSNQLSNSIPRPAPINVNQQLPPLPPHHHYHQSPIGGGGIPFPHEDLEKRGLRASNNSSYSPTSSNGSGVYSPTGATSSSASLLQAYYGGEQGLGAASNEFYGIADMKKSPRLPEYSGLGGGLSPGGSSTYYNSSNGNSYLEYSSQSSGRNSHSYPHSNASTSSASLSSYNNDGLALSDSESEAGPFERLSLAERMANTKPSPTNSMRSLENRSSTVTSNDRSPRNSGNYTGYVNNTSNVNPSMMSMSTSQNQLFLASNSIDSTLSLSTLSSNNSTYHRYDVTPPSSMLGPSHGNNNALSPSSYHGNVVPPQQKNHNQFQTYNNDINNHHSTNQQSNVMSMGGHNWNR